MSTKASDISEVSAQTEASTPLRFVTAASLFDGHDAAINVMRRLIQAEGTEVIHLGHNRGAETAASRLQTVLYFLAKLSGLI